MKQLLLKIIDIGISEECDDDTRLTRRVFSAACLGVCVLAPLWGAIYIGFGEVGPGLIPTIYSVVTAANFYALTRTDSWQWFRVSQLALIFMLPFALMLSLGGYIPGSAVMLWALLAPVGSLWGGRIKEAGAWTIAFLLGAIFSGVIDPWLRHSNNLPDALIIAFFVMNIMAVTGILAFLLVFYVRQKDALFSVMVRNRELETTYLAQEISLRQSDKLATLGRLSAGVAHELNNPTAAAQQATRELDMLVRGDQQGLAEHAALNLGDEEEALFDKYRAQVDERVRAPEFLDPLTRSDRESEVQDILEEMGMDTAWELSPSVVAMGLEPTALREFADLTGAERFKKVIDVLVTRYRRQALLGTINESTDRIITIVKALKTYTYLDQGARQLIDIHEGLESTLVVLQSLLKTGIEVQRSFDSTVPQIEAHGSELNQVWTNIIDNAIAAMGGEGIILIATRRVGDHIEVVISDNGPGIPQDVLPEIFDPFVTTKAPGEGTGLGLNIAHNIVTQRHKGDIRVATGEHGTTFTVSLPLVAPDDAGDGLGGNAKAKTLPVVGK
jgi:signal transduction histidine kinase